MGDLIYRDEAFQIIGCCMEVHRELGKGHDEVIYKDALQVEFGLRQIPFAREKPYTVSYKGVVLPHRYFADFVLMDKIIVEAKAVESLNESHVKQVLNYLAAARLKLGILVNFGEDSLAWKRVVL
ncbi:MAG: GxxExxY protein [Verrucomicrobiae bacterium]|nr:GxxExxY protein [Verrucomicrobiae bacterium]